MQRAKLAQQWLVGLYKIDVWNIPGVMMVVCAMLSFGKHFYLYNDFAPCLFFVLFSNCGLSSHVISPVIHFSHS